MIVMRCSQCGTTMSVNMDETEYREHVDYVCPICADGVERPEQSFTQCRICHNKYLLGQQCTWCGGDKRIADQIGKLFPWQNGEVISVQEARSLAFKIMYYVRHPVPTNDEKLCAYCGKLTTSESGYCAICEELGSADDNDD